MFPFSRKPIRNIINPSEPIGQILRSTTYNTTERFAYSYPKPIITPSITTSSRPNLFSSHKTTERSSYSYPELGMYFVVCAEERRDREDYFRNLRLLYQHWSIKMQDRARILGSYEASMEECTTELIQAVHDAMRAAEDQGLTRQKLNPNYLSELYYCWTHYWPEDAHKYKPLWEYVAGMPLPYLPPIEGPFWHEQQILRMREEKQRIEDEKKRKEEEKKRKAKETWERIQNWKPDCLRA